MSQEAVEQALGRLVTDERFRRMAAQSLEAACLQEGYRLLPWERLLLSRLDPKAVEGMAAGLDIGLRRCGDGKGRTAPVQASGNGHSVH